MTWTTNNAPNYLWDSVASSADGTELVAVGLTEPNTNVLYASTNFGTTWTQIATLPNANAYAIASSADGTKLVLAGWQNPIYVSTNLGSTWTAYGNSDTYTTVASSADGTKLVAAGWDTSAIYTSTDSGISWTAHSVPYNSWESSACSADGTKMVVVGAGNPIYLSTNSGDTWLPDTNAPQTLWESVASSGDGNKIVAFDMFDYLIYVSTNSGTTWTSNSPPSLNNLRPVYLASSADGNKLVAAVSNGAIFTAYSQPSPQLSLTPASSNLTFSWLIPSTNFVLQQSLDLSSWTDVTNAPTLNLTTLQDVVTLSPTNSSNFYRLASQ